MNYSKLFFAFIMIGFLALGCSKDDNNADDKVDLTKGFFKADITWSDKFKALPDVAPSVADLPTNIDIKWDKEQQIDSTVFVEQKDNLPEGAYYGQNNEGKSYTAIASSNGAKDSIVIAFNIADDMITSKKYTVASGDVLKKIIEAIFSGKDINVDGAQGTVFPLFAFTGDLGSQVTGLTFLASPDFGDSFFEITNIDQESQKISGKFKIAVTITTDEGSLPVYTIDNGEFSNLPLVRK